MSCEVRGDLERHREQLAGRAAARLAREQDADISQELARLDAIDKILTALPVARWRRLQWPAVAALVCLAAVWALWTVTIDALGVLGVRTGVVLAVQADTVHMRVSGEWEDSERVRLADGWVRIERAALTFSDPRQGFATLPDDAWVDVKAAGATLQDLRLEPGTELTLERADGEALAVYATGGGAAGSVLVNGVVSLTWGETDGAAAKTRNFRVDVPERMTFSAARQEGVPARIVLEPEGTLALHDLAVSGLRFGREVATEPGEPTFISTVRAGQLRVPDVDESYDLSVGSSVILRGLEGYVRQLRVENRAGDEDTIAVDLEGTVERVAMGPRGRERDVTPSVLSYLYHNQRLAFLFAAASFVWGALWSLRRLIGA